jgi:hypothetical protein
VRRKQQDSVSSTEKNMKSYENVKRNKRKLKRKISAALTKTSDKRFLFAKTKKKKIEA